MPAKPRRNRNIHIFAGGSTTVRIKVILGRGLKGPTLPLTVDHSDPCFVVKAKVECALRLLHETQGEGVVGIIAAAEDIELEYRGIPLRDMTTIDRYGIESGAEINAAYVPQPSERDSVPRESPYLHLDAQIMAETGVPSTGTIKRIIARHGRLCQVCWRRRWFRAQILQVYSTSILLGWHDWSESEWPHFFVKVHLAASPGAPPDDTDETWRLRWHPTTPCKSLPIVQPRFGQLPPLNWVKAFLRTYATSDESQMLREIQSSLPRELVEAAQIAAARHRCIVLGSSGVGKSTLISALCAGPPPPAAPTLALDGLSAAATEGDIAATNAAASAMGIAARGNGGGRKAAGNKSKYWPTVGTKCSSATVHTPGLAPLTLELWDTSGNPRFKPLSLVFYRQAQSVILVFDVKSMQSFRALGAVGGWLHEFTRLTGHSPRNFPFVLVGNKSEEDLMHHRQVSAEDVREWLYREGLKMPYIETSFGGDPRGSWRHAEHVFRTVARTANRLKENYGRHKPPETVRVSDEVEYSDEVVDIGSLEDIGSFVEKSFIKRFGLPNRRERKDKDMAPAPAPAPAPASAVEKAPPASLAEQFNLFKEKASNAAEELMTCGKRSLDQVKGKFGGKVAENQLVVRPPT